MGVGQGGRGRAWRSTRTVAVGGNRAFKKEMSKRRRDPEEDENVDPRSYANVEAGTTANFCGCARTPRVGWSEAEFLSQPLGVWNAVKFDCGREVGHRRHALFGARSAGESWSFLGCFETDHAAAAAWDMEARKKGYKMTNAPAAGESSAADALRERVLRIERSGPDSGFPYVTVNPTWRAGQMRKLLADVAAGALNDIWSQHEGGGGRSLQQQDHWRAPGALLCYSFNPHVFATRKARSCGPGWMDGTQPRLSAVEWWESARGNRLRCVRSLIERCAELREPLAADEAAECDDDNDGARDLLRREVVIFSGSWVLTFQPLVAAAIYRRFAPLAGAVVWDPSAGWGGRLLGAAAAGNVGVYIGCEPSSQTHEGLVALNGSVVAPHAPHLRVELLKQGAEATCLPASSVDLVFTSPPYFNLELYSATAQSLGESSQSHMRFPTASWWKAQFLGKMVRNSYACLRPGGHLLLNVCNNVMLSEGGLDLEASVVEAALREGFTHLTDLSPLSMLKPRMDGGSPSASEPIFVFRKAEEAPRPRIAAQEAQNALQGSEQEALENLVGDW